MSSTACFVALKNANAKKEMKEKNEEYMDGNSFFIYIIIHSEGLRIGAKTEQHLE